MCAAWIASIAGAAQEKSSLVAAVDSPPAMMNPHGDDSDANLSFMANFFDGLLQRGPDGKLAPALAVRWENPDPLTWKFELRKGVKFQNGDAFTAADVKFTFERIADPKVSLFISLGQSIASIDVIDDYNVSIKTKVPVPWFAENLHQIFIMGKKSTEAASEGDIMTRPNGTGAYKLIEWVKGSHLKLEANPEYWGGAPPIKDIEIRPITESSTRFAALASGQVDLVSGVPVELYAQVAKNPKLQVVTEPSRRCIFLAMGNSAGMPTADIRVRQAIYMAINEDEIIKKVMHDQAAPSAQVADPPTVGYNADLKRLPFDPQKAKALLQEAGYGEGFDITLSGPNDRYVQDAAIAQAVAEYLAKVSIRVKLDVKPKSIFMPEVNQGKYTFYLIGWFDGAYDLGRTYSKMAHTRDKERGFGELNGAAYSDATIDKLLEASSQIGDLTERKKALENMNKIAMEEKVLWIPLHYQANTYAVQKDRNIHFQPRPDAWIVLKEISFDK
jgi:peptide/nickel transport system substrate-binding protein